jgi:hypothetical protein
MLFCLYTTKKNDNCRKPKGMLIDLDDLDAYDHCFFLLTLCCDILMVTDTDFVVECVL